MQPSPLSNAGTFSSPSNTHCRFSGGQSQGRCISVGLDNDAGDGSGDAHSRYWALSVHQLLSWVICLLLHSRCTTSQTGGPCGYPAFVGEGTKVQRDEAGSPPSQGLNPGGACPTPPLLFFFKFSCTGSNLACTGVQHANSLVVVYGI